MTGNNHEQLTGKLIGEGKVDKAMFDIPYHKSSLFKPIKIICPSEWDININKINDININENDNPDNKYTIELIQTLSLLTIKIIKKKYIEGYDMEDAITASLYCRSKFGGVKWIDINFDMEKLDSFNKFVESIEDKGMVKVHTDITKLMDNRCYITSEEDYAVDGDNQVGVMSIDTYEGNITVNL